MKKEYVKPTIKKEEVSISDVITASTATRSFSLVGSTKDIHGYTGDIFSGSR